MLCSLVVRSSLNCTPTHQPVATNSMQLQSAYTPHLHHLSNRKHIWIPAEHLRWLLSIFAEELDHGCLTGF